VTPEPARGRFVTTRWTLVNAAGEDSAAAREALAYLCQAYWPPLYTYLRRRGHAPEDAQDLTQGFFARLLERRDVRAADQDRGRFRSFLLTALKRYAINESERATTRKRGGRTLPMSLDFDAAERAYAVVPNADPGPDRLFDRQWAMISLARAIDRLRDDCRRAGKEALAEALMPYLTDAGELRPYAAVAADLGLSEGAVKVAVHRLRQRFGVVLKLEIAETVVNPAEVDDEVRELLRAVSP
jgi:RNA polymerase sigma-70 factor (ECF subfamily)